VQDASATQTKPTNPPVNARFANLTELRPFVETWLCPVPCKATLVRIFDAAGIPRFKANPTAKRGGGPVYYSVSAVEKFFKNRANLRGPVASVGDGGAA
jgi:hypothetical protein